LRRTITQVYSLGMVTKGAAALRLALREQMSQSALARILDVSQPTISDWVNGKCAPKPKYQVALKYIFGISFIDWLTAEDREMARRAVRAAKQLTK
jgi:transcriptional regulator with XRE-family HTH domain